MLKTLLPAASFCMLFHATAQISMTLQVPPSGVIIKSQLWNILLVNKTGADEVQITLALTDANTSEPVLSGLTLPFILNSGTSQLTAKDLAIQYDYLSPVIADRDPNGFLPAGSYEACFTLTQTNHPVPVEACINITVEPLSPPLLNMPLDESASESSAPQFNWLPPSPLNMFSELNYDLILVEVQKGQAPAVAIQQNVPVFLNIAIPNIFCNYPSSNTPLDTSKLYAWQIVAKNGNQYAAQSDVWTFRVKTDSTSNTVADNDPYIKLKRQLDASFSVCYGILKFNYNNESEDSIVAYNIFGITEEDNGNNVREGEIKVNVGENFLALPLVDDNRLIPGKMYLLQLFNSRNEYWNLKFIYQLPKNDIEQTTDSK